MVGTGPPDKGCRVIANAGSPVLPFGKHIFLQGRLRDPSY